MSEAIQESVLTVGGDKNEALTSQAIVDVFCGAKEEKTQRERLVQRVNANIDLLSQSGMDLSDLSISLVSQMVLSEHFERVLFVAYKLDIADIGSIAELVRVFDIEAKGLFSIQCFEECYDHFGKEELQRIFSPQKSDADVNGTAVVDPRLPIADEQRRKIIEFCTHN